MNKKTRAVSNMSSSKTAKEIAGVIRTTSKPGQGTVGVYSVRKRKAADLESNKVAKLFVTKAVHQRLKIRVAKLEEQIESLGRIVAAVTDFALEGHAQWVLSDDRTWIGSLVVPCSIYLAGPNDETDPAEVEAGVIHFLNEFVGVDRVISGEIVRGSWFRRIWPRIQGVASSDEVKDRLKLAETAVKEQLLEHYAAENVNQRAAGAAALIESIKSEDNAILLIGPLAVVKTTDESGKSSVKAVCLTAEQMQRAHADPKYLSSPSLLLSEIIKSG